MDPQYTVREVPVLWLDASDEQQNAHEPNQIKNMMEGMIRKLGPEGGNNQSQGGLAQLLKFAKRTQGGEPIICPKKPKEGHDDPTSPNFDDEGDTAYESQQFVVNLGKVRDAAASSGKDGAPIK